MTSLTDFLDHDLFPALYRVLDQAFPEFGFRARPQSWVATNDAHSRTLPSAPRPDRVECYTNTPFGFTVHGGDFVPWLAYLSGGQMPRGEEFMEAVEKVARKAGVPLPATLEPAQRSGGGASGVEAEVAQRQRTLLETFVHFARNALTQPNAAHARTYLSETRGFTPDTWDSGEFGYYPSVQAVRDHLRHAGFSDDEIGYPAAEVGEGKPIGSGVLYDGRWEGRLIGTWRDIGGRIINLWARDLSGTAEEHAKYLMLKGGSKRTPFGLHNVRKQEVIIVEGFMDALALRRAGVDNVVAVGGAGLSEEQVQRLVHARVRSVILNFDADPAGHAATEQALKRLRGSDVRVYVVNPSRMAESGKRKVEGGNDDLTTKDTENGDEYGLSLTTNHSPLSTVVDGEHDVKQDPDSFLRTHGVAGYRALLRTATRGMVYFAERTFAHHDLTTPQGRDSAFDSLIPAIESLQDEREREESLQQCAIVLGYSYEALKGLFSDYATRKRAQELQRDLAQALRTGQQALDQGEAPPLQIAQGLAGALAKLQSKVLDEPQPFSVIRLDEVTRHLPRGIPSGWGALDKLGDQFNAGELTVFGARTGHGKTTVQTNLLANWLRVPMKGSTSKFIFYSMEEPEVRVYHRLLAVLTASAGEGWSANEVRDFLRDPHSRETWHSSPLSLLRAKEQLMAWEDRLMIVHRPQWTIADIEAHARAQAEQHAIAGVMVDYLQRITVPQGEKYDRRDIEVTVVARRLKGLAETLAAPIVAAAQIGREAVRDGMRIPDREAYLSREVQKAIRSRRPKLHQLREGGSEQEADFVLGLLNYRADYEMDDEERGRQEVPPVTKLEIGILKNRYGTPGHWATLAFEGRYGLLRDAGYGELEG